MLVAADFFTAEVWTSRGLRRFVVLFLIDLAPRCVEIAGVAAQANGLWMGQVSRNLSDEVDGFLMGKRYLIHDRDPRAVEFLDSTTDRVLTTENRAFEFLDLTTLPISACTSVRLSLTHRNTSQ